MVVCVHCGKRFTALAQLLSVHCLGLALVGNCPDCNTLISAAALWHVTIRMNYPEEFPAPGRPVYSPRVRGDLAEKNAGVSVNRQSEFPPHAPGVK
jgi:hypothetical protein